MNCDVVHSLASLPCMVVLKEELEWVKKSRKEVREKGRGARKGEQKG